MGCSHSIIVSFFRRWNEDRQQREERVEAQNQDVQYVNVPPFLFSAHLASLLLIICVGTLFFTSLAQLVLFWRHSASSASSSVRVPYDLPHRLIHERRIGTSSLENRSPSLASSKKPSMLYSSKTLRRSTARHRSTSMYTYICIVHSCLFDRILDGSGTLSLLIWS